MLDQTKAKKTYTKLSRQEIFAVGKEIEKVCKLVGGYAVYDEGWNDGAVHATCVQKHGIRVPVQSVANLRQEIVGNLTPNTADAREAHRLKRIEDRLALLEQRERTILALEDILSRMADWAASRPKDPFSYNFTVLMREWTHQS